MSDTDSLAFFLEAQDTTSATSRAKSPALHKPPLHHSSTGIPPPLQSTTSPRARDDLYSDNDSIAFAMEPSLGSPAPPLGSSPGAAGGLNRSVSMASNASIQFVMEDSKTTTGRGSTGAKMGASPPAAKPSSPSQPLRPSGTLATSVDNSSFAFVEELPDPPPPQGAAGSKRAAAAGTESAVEFEEDSSSSPLQVSITPREEEASSSMASLQNVNKKKGAAAAPAPAAASTRPQGGRTAAAKEEEEESVIFFSELDDSSVGDSQQRLPPPPKRAAAGSPSHTHSPGPPPRKTAVSARLKETMSSNASGRRLVRLPATTNLKPVGSAAAAAGGRSSPPLGASPNSPGYRPPLSTSPPPVSAPAPPAAVAADARMSNNQRGSGYPLSGTSISIHSAGDEGSVEVVEEELEILEGDEGEEGFDSLIVNRHLQEQEKENEFHRREYVRVASSTVTPATTTAAVTAAGAGEAAVVTIPSAAITAKGEVKKSVGSPKTRHTAGAGAAVVAAKQQQQQQAVRSGAKGVLGSVGSGASPPRPRAATTKPKSLVTLSRSPSNSRNQLLPPRSSQQTSHTVPPSGAANQQHAARFAATVARDVEEAARVTQQWKLFNAQQRKEIVRLQQSIRTARMQQPPSSSSSLDGAQPPHRSSDRKKPLTVHHQQQHSSIRPSAVNIDERSSRKKNQMSGSPLDHPHHHHHPSYSLLAPPAAASSSAAHHHSHSRSQSNLKEERRLVKTGRRHHQSNEDNRKLHRDMSDEDDDGYKRNNSKRKEAAAAAAVTSLGGATSQDAAAAAAVASLLGVVWPPRHTAAGDVGLFFHSGAKLTPGQVNRFAMVVAAQSAAREYSMQRVTAAFASGGGGTTAASTTTSSSAHRVSRSTVLREVYELMKTSAPIDEEGRGCDSSSGLSFDMLPAVKEALEEELSLVDNELAVGAACLGLPSMKARSGGSASRPSLLQSKNDGTPFSSSSKAWRSYSAGWRSVIEQAEADLHQQQRQPYHSTESHHASSAVPVAVQVKFARLYRHAVLLSFTVNVVLPLLLGSEIREADFPTVALLVLTALEGRYSPFSSTSEGVLWREVIGSYFQSLCELTPPSPTSFRALSTAASAGSTTTSSVPSPEVVAVPPSAFGVVPPRRAATTTRVRT